MTAHTAMESTLRIHIQRELQYGVLSYLSFSSNRPSFAPLFCSSTTAPPQVRVQPGEEVSLYVHSELGSDMAIVYDNMRWASGATHDQYLQVGGWRGQTSLRARQ